jgi:hypothetical protein
MLLGALGIARRFPEGLPGRSFPTLFLAWATLTCQANYLLKPRLPLMIWAKDNQGSASKQGRTAHFLEATSTRLSIRGGLR